MKKLLSLLLVFIVNIYAEDMDVSVSQINGGFIKNPPLELTKKFPMCDAFLNVDWIDKTKKIGYSTYDLYKNGKKDGRFYSLVMMSEGKYIIDLDAYSYKRQGKLNELFEAARKGKIIDSGIFRIKYKNKFYDLHGTSNDGTLADNHINVCIEHPNHGRAWIVEGRKLTKIYTEEQRNAQYQKIHETVEIEQAFLNEHFIVIDLNQDGKEDYFYGAIYSNGDKYYSSKRVQLIHDMKNYLTYEESSYPPNNEICTIPLIDYKHHTAYRYLTTDGYNYYLGNKCNLTELTKGEK